MSQRKNIAASPPAYPPFQKALPYFPDYGYQVRIHFKSELDKALQNNITELVTKLKDKCAQIDASYPIETNVEGKVPHSGFNFGFALDFWQEWCTLLGNQVSVPVQEAIDTMKNNNFMKQHSKLKYNDGLDLWIFLKADEQKDIDALLEVVQDWVQPTYEVKVLKTNKKLQGRVFGGQFLDGISNAVDAVSMITGVLVPSFPTAKVDPKGGVFSFIQDFIFDKEAFSDNSQPVIENMIGRDSFYSETLARPVERCHIKRARIIDPVDGSNTNLLRQALPLFLPKLGGSSNPMSDGLAFVAFGQSASTFSQILDNILGLEKEAPFVPDMMFTNVQGIDGKFFYCPNTKELAELPNFTADDQYPPVPFWSTFKSANDAYFYNHIQYLYTMSTNYKPGDPPSPRILYLLSKVFSRWHSTWTHKFDVPRIPHLKEFLKPEESTVMEQPIQIRKGYSYMKMLGEVFTSHEKLHGDKIYGNFENFDTYRLDAKELIVGVTDRLSLGSGREVMPYLKEGSERTLSFNLALAEDGNMGHIVPGHNYLLELGVAGMLNKLKTLKEKAKQEGSSSNLDPTTKSKLDDKVTFYQSAIYAYTGVQQYLEKYSILAKTTSTKATDQRDKANLVSIAERMHKLAFGDPKTFTFHDAIQMIFSMHCCLHLCGQQISVGRVDQLLISYYRADVGKSILTELQAQEIIDAFCVKFDEHVVLNRYNIPYGHTTYGFGAVTGRGGPFPTGDSMNQWIQQVTVGGCDADGEDACNEITMMFLKACRRLPLNAPCISLRLTESTPKEIKDAAASALLSGGAHPILYHDRKMIKGLTKSLEKSYKRSKKTMPPDLIKVARDYCCDGCYEPMFTGKSDFKFAYTFVLKAVIYTINCGANYQGADTLHLIGGVESYRTALPEEIATFDDFKSIFRLHLKVMVRGVYGEFLNSYGNPWKICPSPLLSCLLEGCLDSGKDMTNGGSRYHILTPMYVGFTNTVNSLYNVKKMVYDDNCVTTLETLRMALINNWGENMVEPFYDTTGDGVIHTKMWDQKMKELRDYALMLPKFGTDSSNDEINELAQWVAKVMEDLAYECLYEEGPLLEQYKVLQERHTVDKDKPFLFQVLTGCGTFESYVSVGASCAATPDGRLSGQPVASDVSQQPFAQDQPVPNAPPLDIVNALLPYKHIDKFFPNGCEVDITIPEDFPKKSLLEFIEAYIKSKTGSNLVTVTCVNPEVLEKARLQPQRFDLVRNRMGGWSNFFVSMPNSHQLQHMRRPAFKPHDAK